MSKQYWIGDLCYVVKDWDDFCAITMPENINQFDKNQFIEGDITLTNGAKVSYHSTAYGDGTYYDQYGKEYGVDAGLIGVIAVEDIDREDHSMDGGQIYEFDELPSVEYNNGTIIIGHISIETGDNDEDYRNEYEDEDAWEIDSQDGLNDNDGEDR